MCGIVGYIGSRSAGPLIIDGLQRVEYRGYDSVGVTIIGPGAFHTAKHADPVTGQSLAQVAADLGRQNVSGTVGLGHTRWATHGEISAVNAHPHADCRNRIAVAHNGQLANPDALRAELERQGHHFLSATDTECLAHLIERFRLSGDTLFAAVQKTALLVKDGAFAFVAIDLDEPEVMAGACLGSELYIGVADHGQFLASDHRAFRAQTDMYIVIEDGQSVLLRHDGTREVTSFDNEAVDQNLEQLYYEIGEIEKSGYPFFMEAEIHHQANMIPRILDGRFGVDGSIHIGGIHRNPAFQSFVRQDLQRIYFLACGTSYYAATVLERYAHELGFDARSINAGEYCTAPVRADARTLVVPISQSGTTAEVLRATDKASQEGGVVWPLVNVPGSRLSRFGRGRGKKDPLRGMYLQAGLETGVASTKAFTAQILNGAIFLNALAALQGRQSTIGLQQFCSDVRQLQSSIAELLARGAEYQDLGAAIVGGKLTLFLGKGYAMAVAEEGALKFKEIVYAPAYGHSASDLKHGPIAMLDDDTWVIAVCLHDEKFPDVYEWTLLNVEQVLSRKGRVVLLAEEGDQRVEALMRKTNAPKHLISVPPMPGPLGAMLAVIPLQFLALGAAKKLGNPIDKPRHLAKSSTVV